MLTSDADTALKSPQVNKKSMILLDWRSVNQPQNRSVNQP